MFGLRANAGSKAKLKVKSVLISLNGSLSGAFDRENCWFNPRWGVL
jgi:hypothetical protein